MFHFLFNKWKFVYTGNSYSLMKKFDTNTSCAIVRGCIAKETFKRPQCVVAGVILGARIQITFVDVWIRNIRYKNIIFQGISFKYLSTFPFWKLKRKQLRVPWLQLFPVKPGEHTHVLLDPTTIHVPLFSQLTFEHGPWKYVDRNSKYFF